MTLDSCVFDNFEYADELSANDLRLYEACALVSNSVCGNSPVPFFVANFTFRGIGLVNFRISTAINLYFS